jgi:type II secretory pathway pseudopilin PulG
MRQSRKAFSIIEIVIALSLFGFCIVGIFGLLPIALNAVKSVQQEAVANNFWCSITGLWDVVKVDTRSTPISIPIIGNFTLSQDRTFYLTEHGVITDDSSKGNIKVIYKLTDGGGITIIDTSFIWPANAPDSSLTRRELKFTTAFL